MTGKQLMRLGIDSAAAKACVPMCLEPTAPLIGWNDGWVAEFWYYFVDTEDRAVYRPQFYLAVEIPGGKPIKMQRIFKYICCLGSATELFENEYYNKQNMYLEKCIEIMEAGEPSEDVISSLRELWLSCLPEKLKDILKDESVNTYYVSSEAEKRVYRPQKLIDVLKMEMSEAIKKGDTKEIYRIQNEMTKLIK